MRYHVLLHPMAESDLESIFDYIATVNPMAALRTVKALRAHCEMLETMARRGPLRLDLGEGIRTLAFQGRATIAYRVTDTEVTILRILYGGQDHPDDWPVE